MGRWDQVVGEEVASHCHPETFEDQVLTVRTDSTAWATQVRLLAPSVLARLSEELGAGVVTRLVVKGPAGPSWKRGHRTVQGGAVRATPTAEVRPSAASSTVATSFTGVEPPSPAEAAWARPGDVAGRRAGASGPDPVGGNRAGKVPRGGGSLCCAGGRRMRGQRSPHG